MSDLRKFLSELCQTAYPEPPSEMHTEITRKMWSEVRDALTPDSLSLKAALDIGCGQGVGLSVLSEVYKTIGISLSNEDVQACREQRFVAFKADMHDLSTQLAGFRFDLIWMRHALEHSPFPLWVLRQVHGLLKDNGHVYIETPAPGTSARHETNPNHYSVFTAPAWTSLIERSGFEIIWQRQIDLVLEGVGQDCYYAWLAKKK